MRRLVFAALAVALVVGGTLLWTRLGVVAPGPFEPTAKELEELAFYQQPEAWFLEQLQGPRETLDGQTLDPKLQYIAENTWRPASGLTPVLQALFSIEPGRRWIRSSLDREWQLYTQTSAPMRSVEDRQISGRDGPVSVRIYTPDVSSEGPLPLLVYSHGGGWVFASVDALDRVTRLIANEAQAIVVSVNFRLAPEHPYPAASDDGEDAYLWAREQAVTLGSTPELVSVGGDSAGGHVSINVVQRQLIAGRPVPRTVLLYYPGTGLPLKDRSYELFAKGYGLDSRFIDFILPQVFPGMTLEDTPDDLMDPLRAKSLAGFPPTIVATAGFDILRDSGRAFAERLQQEGAAVAYFNYASLTHSFLQFSAIIADAERATVETARLFGATARSGVLNPAEVDAVAANEVAATRKDAAED